MTEQFEVTVKHLPTLEGRHRAATNLRYFLCRATGQPFEP